MWSTSRCTFFSRLVFRNWIGTKGINPAQYAVCPDLEHIQRPVPGLQAEIIPRSSKLKCIKVLKCLQWMSIKIMNNLSCTNHNEVHKSEVDSAPCVSSKDNLGKKSGKKLNMYVVCKDSSPYVYCFLCLKSLKKLPEK